ncbi:PIR protein [Plasmodium ovale]|uniref:PIR protein n=1 Tax=Plasmodium ovale TaxID=36330 RepID=A0A1D3JBU2_PLAOA|nr:PIR protein [Plasmodium ovale]
MPLEIQTIYNAAYSNCIYKDKLDSYQTSTELQDNNICLGFTNSHINNQNNAQKICKAAILFFKDLNDQEHKYADTTYEDTKYKDKTYRDNGCKYLFYWLYTDVLNGKVSIENTLILYQKLYSIYNENHEHLNAFDKYINEMNEDTSGKFVRLTNLYNELEIFFEENKSKNEKEYCTSYSFNSYLKYVDECRSGYDNDFCNELKNFRKKYNFFIQKVIKCQGKKDLLPPVEKSDIIGIILTPFTLILLTSLILPLLYKCTSVGPWIRNKIGKKKNIWDNINEETDQLLNNFEIEENNLNNRNYNIAYNLS